MNGALSWFSGSDLVTDVFKVSSWASSDAEMPDMLASAKWNAIVVGLSWSVSARQKPARILTGAI